MGKIFKWWGVSAVLSVNAMEHFSQFEALMSGTKKLRKVLVLVWIAVVSILWWNRNNVIFNSGNVEVEKADSIQFKVWLWLQSREKNCMFSFYEWMQNPACCVQML